MAQKVALQSLTGDDNPTQRLTSREFEVFRLLAEGKLVEEIAGRLNIGQKTVANYQTSLKQKLDIHSPVELVRLAMKYGVITEQ
jgi:DNA-binding NarL/FixJ family response regulator